MKINDTFCGRRFKSMLFTASVSACVEIANVLVDKVVSAQVLGEKALAAVSMFTPMFSFVFFVSAIVMVGSRVCYSIEIGRLCRVRANGFFGQGLILSTVIGLALLALFFMARVAILNFVGVDPDLGNYVNEFYRYFVWVAFAIPVNCFLQQMVYADGDVKICNASYTVLLGSNAALSFLLGRQMGMEGIALGTLLANVLSTLVLAVHFFRKTNTLKFIWHVTARDSASVVRFSMAESLEFLFFTLFTAVTNHYFITVHGTGPLPVLSMMYELIEMGVLFNGVWLAAEPLINIYRGEKNGNGVAQAMRFVNYTLFKEGVLVSVALFLFAPWVVHLFHIHSGELVGTAVLAVRAAAVGMLPMAIVKVYAAYYEHEQPVLSISMIVMIVFLSPVVCAFGLQTLIPDGFWMGFAVAPFLALALSIVLHLLLYGRKGFPLLLDEFKASGDWHMRNVLLFPESLLAFRDDVGTLLESRGFDTAMRTKVMLLVEELGMTIYERNRGRKIYMEFSVIVKKSGITLIVKDNGVIMDVTDLERAVTDLRAYLVNMFMSTHVDKVYLLTSSYNRHVFNFGSC